MEMLNEREISIHRIDPARRPSIFLSHWFFGCVPEEFNRLIIGYYILTIN
jgi:hypothetical protein